MRSRFLAGLQVVLAGAIVLPARAAGWRAAETLPVVAAVALGTWALSANRPGNFNAHPNRNPGGAS